jgi:hypothetical protein
MLIITSGLTDCKLTVRSKSAKRSIAAGWPLVNDEENLGLLIKVNYMQLVQYL